MHTQRRSRVYPTSKLFSTLASAEGIVFAGSRTTNSFGGYTNVSQANFDLSFRGTRLDLWQIGAGAAYKVAVDGGPFVTVSDGPGTFPFEWITAVQGLPDRWHDVKIRTVSFLVSASSALRVTGVAPAVRYPTYFNPTPNLGAVAAASWPGYSVDGSGDFGSNFSGEPAYAGSGVTSVRLKATTSKLSLFTYQNQKVFQLYVDGVATGSIKSANTATFYDWVHWTELDGATEHEYQIFGDANGYFCQIAAPGGSINTSALTAKKAIVCYGDSITLGVGATTQLSSYASQLAMTKRTGQYNLGIAGSTVHDNGVGSGVTTARTSAVTARASTADRVVILYGTNDNALIPGSYSVATFQGDYQTMLSAIQSGMTAGTKIYCLGVLDRTDIDSTRRNTLNSAISAAVTAVGGTDTSYVNTDGWINTATDLIADGIHPNDSGHAKVAAQLATILP